MSIELAYLLRSMPQQLEAFSKASGHSPNTILMYLASCESDDSEESEDDQASDASEE